MGLRHKAGRASITKNGALLLKTVSILTVCVFIAAFILSGSQYDNTKNDNIKHQLQTETKDSFAPSQINVGFTQSLQNPQPGVSSALQTLPEHHSQPTTMSVQGKATNRTDGSALSSGNVRVKVSNTTSCSNGVIYDETFNNTISSGTFSLTLGEGDTLWTDFNRDYWMCIYVNSELVSGPTKFRSTGGEVNRIGDASSSSYVNFDSGNLIFRSGNLRLDSDKLNVSGNVGIGTGDANMVGAFQRVLTVRAGSDTTINRFAAIEIAGTASATTQDVAYMEFLGNAGATRLGNFVVAHDGATNSGKFTIGTFNSGSFNEVLSMRANQTVRLSGYTGGASAYACIDKNGFIYRSAAACAPSNIGIGTGQTNLVGAFDKVLTVQAGTDATTNRAAAIEIAGTASAATQDVAYMEFMGNAGATRLANMVVAHDGATNSGKFTIGTFNAGSYGSRMTIKADGSVIINSLAGSGNAYICVDNTGKLYRSASACA